MAAHSLKWAHFPLKDSAAVAPISTHLSDYSSDYLDCGVVPTQFEYNLFVCEVRASVSPTAAQQQSRICCWRGDIPLCQKHTDPHISVLIRHRLAIAGLIPHISGTHYPSVTRAETPVRRSRNSSHVYAVEEGTRGDIPLCQKHTDPHISVLICHRLATSGLIPHISGTHYRSICDTRGSVSPTAAQQQHVMCC